MKIVKGTEPVVVAHPVVLLVGQPGIGKSSLGYSSSALPLTLDFDQGAHRAANRKDTLQIATWADVVELMDSDVLDRYKSVNVDTVGRCLDMMIVAMAEESPKLVVNGNPSQQGWAKLKRDFRVWLTRLRSKDLDVLLIAHDKEDKDGEIRKIRADIVGGSYAEVLKNADLVGYLSMNGKERVLDFSPTENYVGKNPGQWPPFKVPAVEKAGTFMADIFTKAREVLGKISEVSADATKIVELWRVVIAALDTPVACTGAVPEIAKLEPLIAREAVKALLTTHVKAKGYKWDKKVGAFVIVKAA